jgi:hypothetical protein
MSLLAPRPVPQSDRQEPDRRALDGPQSAASSAATGMAALALEIGPLPHPKIKRRFAWLLEYLWVGSLLAVGTLALSGLILSLIGPYAHAHASARNYTLGTLIDLRRGGNAGAYLRQGWSAPDAGGTHTVGAVADVVFPPHLTERNTLFLRVYGRPVFAAEDNGFWVDVLVNGARAHHRQFERGSFVANLEIELPYGVVEHAAPLHVTMVVGAAHPGSKSVRGRANSGLEIEAVSLN